MPPLGGRRRKIAILFGAEKLECMVELPDGENFFEDTCNRLDRIPACDGRTVRHLAPA